MAVALSNARNACGRKPERWGPQGLGHARHAAATGLGASGPQWPRSSGVAGQKRIAPLGGQRRTHLRPARRASKCLPLRMAISKAYVCVSRSPGACNWMATWAEASKGARLGFRRRGFTWWLWRIGRHTSNVRRYADARSSGSDTEASATPSGSCTRREQRALDSEPQRPAGAPTGRCEGGAEQLEGGPWGEEEEGAKRSGASGGRVRGVGEGGVHGGDEVLV